MNCTVAFAITRSQVKEGYLQGPVRILPTPVFAFVTPRPQVKEGYFQGLVAAGRVTADEVGEHIFASKPAAGGAVLNLKL